MPFEQPGSSFPGSAFYYPAPDAPSAPLVAGVHCDGKGLPLTDSPAARAKRIDHPDHAKQRERSVHAAVVQHGMLKGRRPHPTVMRMPARDYFGQRGVERD